MRCLPVPLISGEAEQYRRQTHLAHAHRLDHRRLALKAFDQDVGGFQHLATHSLCRSRRLGQLGAQQLAVVG